MGILNILILIFTIVCQWPLMTLTCPLIPYLLRPHVSLPEMHSDITFKVWKLKISILWNQNQYFGRKSVFFQINLSLMYGFIKRHTTWMCSCLCFDRMGSEMRVLTLRALYLKCLLWKANMRFTMIFFLNNGSQNHEILWSLWSSEYTSISITNLADTLFLEI